MKSIIETVQLFNDKSNVGVNDFASFLDVTPKTLVKRIEEYNEELYKYDMHIEFNNTYNWYWLKINDDKKYDEFIKGSIEKIYYAIPDNDDDRVIFVLNKLLKANDYIKRSKLAEMMYVSEKTVSQVLSEVEKILTLYNLKLDRKPSYGIQIIGDEFNKRQCFINRLIVPSEKLGRSNYEESFADIILEISKNNNLQFPEVSFENLLHYVGVLINRINNGFIIEDDNGLDVRNTSETAKDILDTLVDKNFIKHYTKAEQSYLALFLSADRVTSNKIQINTIIPSYLENIVNNLFAYIDKQFGIDLNDNLEIRLYLLRHLTSLDIRLKYDIRIDVSVPDNFKEKCPFAYMIASESCYVIENYYGKKMSDKEIYLLSLFIEVALEKQKEKPHKFNILLVCPTCKISSLLLKTTLESEFDKYINNLEMRSIYDLSNIDFNDYDYIFSTTPIDISVPIPVVLITDIKGQLNIAKVKQTINPNNIYDAITNYYDKELFFTDIDLSTKEEVFEFMLNKIKEKYKIKKDSLDLLLKREALGSTSFFDGVALPHPIEPINKDNNIVCVVLLNKPMDWGNKKVSLVIMSSTYNSKDINTKTFYEVTSKLVFNNEAINKIIENKNYSILINELFLCSNN